MFACTRPAPRLPGAPVQLPFQLQPAKEEELMRYQVCVAMCLYVCPS